MLQFVDGCRRVAAQILDCVLVSEPVRAFHRVVHVPAPVILAHVAQRGRNSALRGHRVRTGGEYFRDACGAQARLAASHHRAQAGATGADNYNVMAMILDRVRAAVDRRCVARIFVRRHVRLRTTA
jgi:hypothetical protein